jgi:hypothetical protein
LHDGVMPSPLTIATHENPPRSPFVKGGGKRIFISYVAYFGYYYTLYLCLSPPFDKGGWGGISICSGIYQRRYEAKMKGFQPFLIGLYLLVAV